MAEWMKIKPDGRTIQELLNGQPAQLPSFCGGRGTCGKCKVMVRTAEGEQEVLACQYIPKKECEIGIPDRVKMEMTSSFQIQGIKEDRVTKEAAKEVGNQVIAVDIGTTTIAMVLADAGGEIQKSWTALNPQRKYGADVITRIQKALEGKGKELQGEVLHCILTGIQTLLQGERKFLPCKVVLAGNTTMQHLFCGFPVEGLGSYPFLPYRDDWVQGTLGEFGTFVPEEIKRMEYQMLPCISAFVGGDILAGMLVIEELEQKEKSWLLLDMGTNGEMVLYRNEIYYTASTAAGPVFEGGGIRWGTGGIPGAIDHINVSENELSCETIGGVIPVGICGTGIIEVMAGLRKLGAMDKSGRLKSGYQKTGYALARTAHGEMITIGQEDIRQFQLAKSAIRTGMELLCEAADTRMEELSHIYLAGGFGTKLDITKTCDTGLLPATVKRKCRAMGNTSLLGVLELCLAKEKKQQLMKMKENSRRITLALEGEFQKKYLEYLDF